MVQTMSSADLNPVSYVLLGLLARDGASTAYELKSAVGRGIAHFWPFPHSQIYSETERLARLGLLTEEREQGGRRRRVYRITKPGLAALRAWLAGPTPLEVQYRDLGVLKLFFGQFASTEDIAGLAASQVDAYGEMFAIYEELLGRLRARGDRPWQLAVGELMFDAHRAVAEHWKAIARKTAQSARQRPPRAARPARRRKALS
jgi:PadR family transcriptional regulator, regulatory protein AphA